MNRAILYVIIALLLGTTESRSSAQTPHHEEQLQEVVVLAGKQKKKKILRQGVRIPGAVISLTPDKVRCEIGSEIVVRHPFVAEEITFDVLANNIEDVVLGIDIYRTDSTFARLLSQPLLINLTQGKKQRITVAPDKQVILEPGRYIVSMGFVDCSEAIKKQWNDSTIWDNATRLEMMKQNILFPFYLKDGYVKTHANDTPEKSKMNVGLRVKGVEYR